MNTKLTTELTAEIEQWVRENGLRDYGGATVASLCKHFGISDKSYQRWMKRKDFADAINEAKQHYAENIEYDLVQSLANAAKGYTISKQRKEYAKDKTGKLVVKKRTTEDVYVPPNVGAAIFLLTNIAPDRWQNKQQQQTDVQGSLSLSVKMLNGSTPKIATDENEVDAER